MEKPPRTKVSKSVVPATTYWHAVKSAIALQQSGFRTMIEGGYWIDVPPYHAYAVWYWQKPTSRRVE